MIVNEAGDPGAPLAWDDSLPCEVDVVVIGGGFTGLMTLAHVLDSCPQARVAVLEREPRRAPGVAYGACDPHHLLNVPAGRMGVVAADVSAFHRWLGSHAAGAFEPGDFVPRTMFGKYLNEEIRLRLAPHRERAWLVRGHVTRLDVTASGVTVGLADGRVSQARAALLSPGIPPGRVPWHGITDGVRPDQLVPDPWREGSLDGVAPDAPVVIVGSGLTAIDVVLGLRARGHRGTITLVSRNGRLPLPHGTPAQEAAKYSDSDLRGSPAHVLRRVRATARARETARLDWHGAIDALRPHATAIWQQWSPRERRQFLRRVRPFWEIHRHRAPRPVLAVLDAMREDGRLTLVRGRLSRLDGSPDGNVEVHVHGPAAGPIRFHAQRVFNCVGPVTSLRETDDPLIAYLLERGSATTDDEGLGLRADRDGRLIDSRGHASVPVFVAGALRRGDLWESTAVPELRDQAQRVAAALVSCVVGREPHLPA
jgi:uncharacterized NAD(P)/FAD-binding protein YdhS